ncbi:MAG: hypothetical protein ACOX42_08030 [Clostridia bacterium]|jgi:hypothetical protein|nr:hypothetical protein [Clostridiales bacterium]
MAKAKNKNKGQVAFTSDEGDNLNIKLPNTDSISVKHPPGSRKRDKKSR